MKLNIPEQTQPSTDEFPTHPRKVKKWLESLKQANMGDYTRTLYNGLLRLNRTSMPADHRFDNMELLRQPVRHVFAQLHKHFVNRTLPLPDKSLKIVNLNQALLSEMANGYKILVFEASNDLNKVDGKHLLIACERVLHYMSEMLLRSSQIYSEYPDGTWWDIHRVYAYAEMKRIHQKTVKDSELKAGSTTVEDLYKQIMLFSLARPNTLRQSDAERVFRALTDWSKRTTLSSQPIANKMGRYYCSRLDTDQPPSCVTEEDIRSVDHVRTVDTTSLANYLNDQIDDGESFRNAVAIGDQVSQETLRTLVASWSLCTKRRFARALRSPDSDTRICIGLMSIYETLTAENKPVSSVKEKKPASMFSLESIPEAMRANRDIYSRQDPTIFITHPELKAEKDKSATSWDLVARGRAMTDSFANELQSKDAQIGELNKEAPDLHWKIANVGAGGYCLHWTSENPSRAQVGELIAVREREPDSTYQWRVGVIRWMQFTRTSGLEIGVQVLAPKVIACTVQRMDRKNEPPFKCLMLPGLKPIQQPSTLLMPAHAFKKGIDLKLNVYERDMAIRLGTIREHTGSFTQFQFANLAEETTTKPKTPPPSGGTPGGGGKKSDPDDFDSIWSSL
jgi:hypothetical protein